MLEIYNSLTRKIEPFHPIEPGYVTMYVCGPTVYGDIHLGNARPVIVFDVLKRYLEFRGYEVRYASNITDVDDKIIDKAKQLNTTEKKLSETYTKAFLDMTRALGSRIPDDMPKATEYIERMIAYIEDLIEKGFAYETKGGIYFRVGKIGDYGTLSQQDIEALNEGVRVALDDEKEDPRDFSIWKKTTEGLNYDSPWGAGRPGWHTECAVMNHELFDGEIDIHGGGSDLKFPHHENEIAQTVAHDGHHLARFWMHVGRLSIESVKMSKSLGNITLVKDLIRAYDPLVFRLFMISHHYRQPIDYSQDLMDQFVRVYDRIVRTLKKTLLVLERANTPPGMFIDAYGKAFIGHMDDDLNTPNAITVVHEIVKDMNKEKDLQRQADLYRTLSGILDVLGVMPELGFEESILKTYEAWENARANKDYRTADSLRQDLMDKGWL
ncbi:MAG: cysteine--tRNA ligase [Acholeplasmataceae bacterium]